MENKLWVVKLKNSQGSLIVQAFLDEKSARWFAMGLSSNYVDQREIETVTSLLNVTAVVECVDFHEVKQ